MIILVAFSLSLSLLLLFIILYKLWWIPLHLQRALKSQGISGPSYKFFHGSTTEIIKMRHQTSGTPMELTHSHDIFPKIQPHVHSWLKLHGKNYLFWIGTQPQFMVTEPELIKEVLMNKEGIYAKTRVSGYIEKLLGDGIVVTEGEKWFKLRKLANHAFHGDCLKDMIPAMIASAEDMLEKWKSYHGKELEVCGEFRHLTSDVISRTAFGSSYLEGRKIFGLLTKLSALISRNMFRIRFLGIENFVRTKDNIEAERMEQLLNDSIMEIVKKRQHEVETGEASSFGTDFLGSLLNAYHDVDPKNQVSAAEIIDECKTFYFGGQETTYSLLSWSTLLLAIHSDWQDKQEKRCFNYLDKEIPPQKALPD